MLRARRVEHIPSARCAGVASTVADVKRHFRTTAAVRSTKYLRHNFTETRQPSWLEHKRYPMFSRENRPQFERPDKSDRVMFSAHQNLWETDTDAQNNPAYQRYFEVNEKLNNLRGKRTSFDTSDTVDYSSTMAPFEMSTDMRYRGHARRGHLNLWYEPHMNRPLYVTTAAQRLRANAPMAKKASAALKKEASEKRMALAKAEGPSIVPYPLTEAGGINFSAESAASWWRELAARIDRHRLAVGDYEPGRARNVQNVHAFFVHFQEAMTNFKFQDADLIRELNATRPKELDDLYAIFLEMELNYINPDFCPRCSLPFATTTHCGEGEPDTPFRKWRGTPVPHKPWGKEWLDVLATRAEALWMRASEDPLFGNSTIVSAQGDASAGDRHSQRQTELMLSILCRTKQRGKANDFMQKIRGSVEFLTGQIQITAEMQKEHDQLLDSTHHPHMLTNANEASVGSAKYLGAANAPAQSAAQLRIDMEVSKMRREQREEGVVRIPPKGWEIDTASVKPYEVHDGRVTNWREVKQSIERSFLSTGLPETAWTPNERREMKMLEAKIQAADQTRAQLEAQLEKEKAAIRKNRGDAAGFVFPDSDFYRVFDISEDAFKTFTTLNRHKLKFRARRAAFARPEAVECTIADRNMKLDTRSETIGMYGLGFQFGTRLELVENAEEGPFEVSLIGVDISGPQDEWQLKGINVETNDVVDLGTDIRNFRVKWNKIEKARIIKQHCEKVNALFIEEFKTWESLHGVVVGVRDGVLYAQFDESSVALPMGRAPDLQNRKIWQFKVDDEAGQLTEPFSWSTPFRNDWAEERLEELKKAPWKREDLAPLTPGKYTPKPKKFGYTQHTTQDDYVTKEYKDRLTSKQVFTNSQKFQIIPDSMARTTATFGPKTDFERLAGVPAVDRRELDNGWGAAADVPDHEVAAVEQALRDISGRRPGNFVKTQREVNSLDIDEPWFQRLGYGWQQTEADNQQLHPAEQTPVDPTSLPFNGALPPANKSLSMGERMRDLVDDWSQGFGLGPHQKGPENDTHRYDTLGSQTRRSAEIGYSSILVRLFNQRLQKDGFDDAASFCARHPTCQNTNPKILLTAIHEFRESGRPPALALAKVLKTYLADDIAMINAKLPEGARPLDVDVESGVVSRLGQSSDVWADVSRDEYRKQYFAEQRAESSAIGGAGETGYVLQKYLDIALQGLSETSPDPFLVSNMRAQYTKRFVTAISKRIGKDVPLTQQKNYVVSKSARMTGSATAMAKQLIRSTEVKAFLTHCGIRREELARIMRGLHAECALMTGKADLDMNDFCLPAQLLLTWNLSSAPSSNQPTVKDATKAGNSGVSGSETEAGSRASSSALGTVESEKVTFDSVPAMIDAMIANNDGYAQDVIYAIRMNRERPWLKDDFKLLFTPATVKDKATTVDQLYENYLTGAYMPRADEAVRLVVSFLKAAAAAGTDRAEPRSAACAALLKRDARNNVVGVLPAPLDKREFEFENVAFEKANTLLRIRDFNLRMGPEGLPRAQLLPVPQDIESPPAAVQSLSATSEPVILRSNEDYGLTAAITEAKLPAQFSAAITKDRFSSTVFANALITRLLPVLPTFAKVAKEFSHAGASWRENNAQYHLSQLRSLDEKDRDPATEQEFRQNAERYWRKILEAREDQAQRAHGMSQRRDNRRHDNRGGQGQGGEKGDAQMEPGQHKPGARTGGRINMQVGSQRGGRGGRGGGGFRGGHQGGRGGGRGAQGGRGSGGRGRGGRGAAVAEAGASVDAVLGAVGGAKNARSDWVRGGRSGGKAFQDTPTPRARGTGAGTGGGSAPPAQ